ncbi:hypothetical protein [Frankia sp. QA3]|nr:hypothetical protein [Frankia sp. QA3]
MRTRMWRRRIVLSSIITVSALFGLTVGSAPAQAATCPATGPTATTDRR